MAVVVVADVEAVEDSPARTLRPWAEVAVGKLTILLQRKHLRSILPYSRACCGYGNCRFVYLGVLGRACAFTRSAKASGMCIRVSWLPKFLLAKD